MSETAVLAEVPRPIRVRTSEDRVALIGSAAASLASTWLLYDQLLPLSGILGFLVSWFVIFLAIYAAVTASSHPRPIVWDRVAAATITAGAAVVGFTLLTLIYYTFHRGHTALFHTNFVTKTAAGVQPTAPLDQGGVLHALVGSGIELGIAVALAMPLGIGTAVYMTEVGGRLAQVVRTVVVSMTALPDILAGLFVYTTFVIKLHQGRTGLAAALALTIMMIPYIARATDVQLRVVPGGLREAGLALGASRWSVVWRVVLPTAKPGLGSATILGLARGLGETAPLLIVSGASTFFNDNPLKNPMNSLPLYIYSAVRSGETVNIERGFGAASLLLASVLLLFFFVRLITRQKVAHR